MIVKPFGLIKAYYWVSHCGHAIPQSFLSHLSFFALRASDLFQNSAINKDEKRREITFSEWRECCAH